MRTPPPSYGIIYNWDGAPHGYSAYPQSLAQFIDKVYAPLEDTQVGALAWCMGLHEATWPSEKLDMVGDSTDRRYNWAREMHHNENIRAFFERGEDLYGALIQRGKEQGIDTYASLRLNDNHFWDLRPGDLATTTRNELTPLRKEHPEWLLGTEHAPDWTSTSWNLAVPEVRDHILKLVGEACQQADWDGVELDWQRHAFHLPDDHGHRLRYTITDLMRAIRTTTDEIAAQRGRPFYLAVRIATTFESCTNIGYDIETWTKENLCDLIISGGNSGTDPGAEIDLLAMTGRFDLIREYLTFLRQRFNTVITSVHHAGITIPLLEAENIPVDGYLTTVNAPGTFMFPTRELAIDAIKNATKPVIAIKPMAGGRFLGHQAFEYVFDEVGVQASMFGMGTIDQVRETTRAAREVLGAA